MESAFAETLATFGRVDSCFVNAGVGGRREVQSFMEMTTAEWRRVLSVNLDGVYHTFKHAARHMRERAERGGGRLVGTASLAAVGASAR